MKIIFGYIKEYMLSVDKRVLAVVSVFTAILIFLNYYFGLDERVRKNSFAVKLMAWYAVFAAAFILPYFIYWLINLRRYIHQPRCIALLLIAPAIFALKLALDIPLHFSIDPQWNNYWNHIIYWPLLAFIIGAVLFILWKILSPDQPFWGLKTKDIDWKPYLFMLLIMLPLVAAASTQADFLAVYPKLRSIDGVFHDENITWWHKLLFELSYGSDFITIELFFRGFLVLAFIKWAGKDAILPMACFYCTIHFGKPLGECISSYFGGIILGIIVYNTRSIFGGLLVHLGIAWMMELGGYIGNPLSP